MIAIRNRKNKSRGAAPSKAKRGARSVKANTNRIRYAVVGLGYIAQVAVLPAFAHAKKNSRLAALVSGTPKKLQKLGRKYMVDQLYSYDQYDDLLRSGEIDAVYLALPNHLHADYTIRAANAGVHVLCEKPMAVTEDECLRMLQACQSNSVKLMIAYRLHFEESNLAAVELVQSGKLGEPRYFESSFSFNITDPDNIRLDRAKGGGTLYDIGIYCINAARYLFQAEPVEVAAFSVARHQPRFKGVDEASAVIMRFPNDRLASFITSFGAGSVSTYRIVGEEGELCADMAYSYAEEVTHYITINNKTRTKTYKRRDQFAPELIYFSNCILRNQDPEPSGEEGLIDVRIIEALYHSARIGQPVPLNLFAPDKRPTMKQEIKKPAVREPKLIAAGSPKEDD